MSWLPADTLLWLLDSLGVFEKGRTQFWIAQDNLRLLFRALQSIGEAAEPIWQRICSLLDVDLLVPGEAKQNGLLMELWTAESQPGLSMPSSVSLALKDWMFLRERFEKASFLPVSARQDVIAACNRLGVDPIPVLAKYFERYILPKGTEKETLDDFVGFFHNFFLDGKEYQDYAARLMAWLSVVENCPNEADKAILQSYYLHGHIPAELHWRLAQDMRRAGRMLETVQNQIPKPTETDLLGIPQAILFQLSGARVPGSTNFGVPSLAWLSPTVLASILAAVICGLFLTSRSQTGAWGQGSVVMLFLPAVIMLAESIALHSTGLLLRNMRGCRCTWDDLRSVFGQQMGFALLVGIIGGLIGGAGAYLWGAPWNLAWRLGCALPASLASAPLGSLAVPLIFRRHRLVMWLPYAILSRASASILALLIFLSLVWVLNA
ncbi:MAG TPA: hypothetical protein VGX70_00180 [Gemmataceae bacterium]|nr:hypothetical protein [Gemmataceae bacterium]